MDNHTHRIQCRRTSANTSVSITPTIHAHSLNSPHDDDKDKCLRFNGVGSQLHIMSRMLDQNVQPYAWSKCSRHYVTEFLENNHALCMLNQPDRDYPETRVGDRSGDRSGGGVVRTGVEPKLAGEQYNAREQCRLNYGQQADVCWWKVLESVSIGWGRAGGW